MSDKKPHKNPRTPNRHQKQAVKVELTPEQQAAILAERAKAEAERVAEEQRIHLYGAAVEKMSHRQLTAELRKTVKREYAGKPPEPQAGLNILLATVWGAVLENTKSVPVTEDGRRLRLDQLNPSSFAKTMNPGW